MNAAELAAVLRFKRSGRQWVGPCVAHADSSPSMIIFEGREAVQVRCLAGCDQRDIIAELKRRGLWGDDDRGQSHHHRLAASTPVLNVSRETPENRERAQQIWDAAQGLMFTPGEQYLLDRGLAPPIILPCARFHPRCPRGAEYAPAVVVQLQAFDSAEPRALQRIYIRREGERFVKDGKPMMLGPAGGAAMKVTPHHETFWDELSFCPRLYVCEGFEDALGLLSRGMGPAWALGSAGAISAFPVVFGIGELMICADNDAVGNKAAERCAARWSAAGHRVELLQRAEPGKDFADG